MSHCRFLFSCAQKTQKHRKSQKSEVKRKYTISTIIKLHVLQPAQYCYLLLRRSSGSQTRAACSSKLHFLQSFDSDVLVQEGTFTSASKLYKVTFNCSHEVVKVCRDFVPVFHLSLYLHSHSQSINARL